MTLTDRRDVDAPAPSDEPNPPEKPRSGRLVGFGVGAAVVVVVALLAQLPLIRNHIFYYWDDSAAAFLPHWYQMGLSLRSGHWPVMDPTVWMGGNLAAESMFGLFNPVSLANYVLVSLLPDLALSATVVKTEFLMLLALGIYLLAREYRAGRPAAAVIATALPFTGYTLYFDAEAWVGGLMCYAWIPLVWWAVRRYARGVLNPFVAVVLGYLAMTTGNPYGALAVIIVLLAVGVEQLVQRRWRRFGGVVLVGASIGISSMVVFLPLLGSSAVTWRTSNGTFNDGFMVPNLGDLLGMSAPTYLPQYHAFATGGLTAPTFYVAWFILPLVPWLSWSTLRQGIRARSSLLVFGLIYLALLVGPSNLWLFRWPARLTEYATLPIGIVFAIVLSKGIRTTMPSRRIIGSAVLIIAGVYLSWSSNPIGIKRHVAAAVLVAALLAVVIVLAKRKPRHVATVMVAGTAIVLAGQAVLYPGNFNITPWYFPHNVAQMKANFARYQGNTLEIGDTPQFTAHAPLTPQGVWKDVLLAGPIHVAGVHALNSYTGIGDVAFANALCMTYYGGTCMDAYTMLWRTAKGTDTNLANVLRLQTIVAANPVPPAKTAQGGTTIVGGLPVTQAPAPAAGTRPLVVQPGWSIQQHTDVVTVYRRDTPIAWPDGRLSWHAPGVIVRSDRSTGDTGERTTYTGSGTVTFAALAWPGWQATVDGRRIPVRQGPAGVIELNLPQANADGSTVELSFTPPGYSLGIPLVGVGLLIGLAYGAFWEVARRRRRSTPEPEPEPAG